MDQQQLQTAQAAYETAFREAQRLHEESLRLAAQVMESAYREAARLLEDGQKMAVTKLEAAATDYMNKVGGTGSPVEPLDQGPPPR